MKILATDLDRTLLPNGSWPPDPGAIDLFNELTERHGVFVVYVTGRNLALTEATRDAGGSLVRVRELEADWRGLKSLDLRFGLGDVETHHIVLKQSERSDAAVMTRRVEGAPRVAIVGPAQPAARSAVERGLASPDDLLSDQQVYELIFHPGFSTAEQVSDVSGRGVGMDVVRRNINELGGSIEIE